MIPGPRNLITDVVGLRVGNAHDAALRSGTTVLTAEQPFTAAVHVMGGAPGTRETDLLSPDTLVQEVDAFVLSGGSAFGLDAASGVVEALRAQGRGFAVGDQRVPIVPGAILFDLLNGGDKDWTQNPYTRLGQAALEAAGETFEIGSHGAGYGATTMDLRGGLGSASCVLKSGIVVGALVAVNALGRTTDDQGRFFAAPFEQGAEFGARGLAHLDPAWEPRSERMPGQSTTIAIVATDAVLTQAQAKRLAIAAHDGMARAIIPSHTPLDGDLVFAAAAGTKPLADPVWEVMRLGHAGAACLARAIARGVYAARGGDASPAWADRF